PRRCCRLSRRGTIVRQYRISPARRNGTGDPMRPPDAAPQPNSLRPAPTRRWPLRAFAGGVLALVAILGWVAGAPALAVAALFLTALLPAAWPLGRAAARLVGPLYFYELVRLARRGRSTLLRCAYALLLLAGLYSVYVTEFPEYDPLAAPFAS